MDPALDLALRAALALLFGAAALHKARDLPGFRAILADYRLLPSGLVRGAAVILIALEGCLAAALLFPVWHASAAWAAILLLALYTGAIGINLARGRRHIDCGCGGPALGQPLGGWLLVRNGILMMIALAVMSPPASRTLVMLDALTVTASAASLALLYAAANRLISEWPAHRRLRRNS
jgi:hypothetical protein